MHNLRCRCGKIVCQVQEPMDASVGEVSTEFPRSAAAVIMCRHCKTYVVLWVPAISAVQYAESPTELQGGHFSTDNM
ncbi:MAG: hypothetical protein ACM3XM_08295 [Mycobacterium leprae]